jgi:hypothetical protein
MRSCLLLTVMSLLAMAAAPKEAATTPVEVPPYGWKVKDGAPQWAADAVDRWIKNREVLAKITPKHVAEEQHHVTAIEAGKVDSKAAYSGGITNPKTGVTTYVFRTAADKTKALENRQQSLGKMRATLARSLDPLCVPGVIAKAALTPEVYRDTAEIPAAVALKVLDKIDAKTAVAELYLGASAQGPIESLKLNKPDAPKVIAWVQSEELMNLKTGELGNAIVIRSGTRTISGRGELPAMVQPDIRPWLEPVK